MKGIILNSSGEEGDEGSRGDMVELGALGRIDEMGMGRRDEIEDYKSFSSRRVHVDESCAVWDLKVFQHGDDACRPTFMITCQKHAYIIIDTRGGWHTRIPRMQSQDMKLVRLRYDFNAPLHIEEC